MLDTILIGVLVSGIALLVWAIQSMSYKLIDIQIALANAETDNKRLMNQLAIDVGSPPPYPDEVYMLGVDPWRLTHQQPKADIMLGYAAEEIHSGQTVCWNEQGMLVPFRVWKSWRDLTIAEQSAIMETWSCPPGSWGAYNWMLQGDTWMAKRNLKAKQSGVT